MKRFTLVFALSVAAGICQAQTASQQRHASKAITDPTSSSQAFVLTPLSPPYVISTAPHFAILVQFPKADSIRRIALGDSGFFLAEADKDDPHYAIVKQIQVPNGKAKAPIQTNMLVYMASGRVINVSLKSGELGETAYLIDYPVPKAEPEPAPSPPLAKKSEAEESIRRLVEEMVKEVKASERKEGGTTSGSLTLRLYRTERVGDLALVSFDVENAGSKIVDVEGPQLNLVTLGAKAGHKKPAVNVEPVQLVESILSPKQLAPGTRAIGLIQFRPPVHDSNQRVMLSIANRAMADAPAQVQIE
jgi:hypothetical protein